MLCSPRSAGTEPASRPHSGSYRMTTASEIPAGDSLTGGNFYWGKNVISVTPAGQRREELEAFLWRCGLSAAYVDAGLAAADRYAESLFLDLTGGENTS